MTNQELKITYVPIETLKHPEKNPRYWSNEVKLQLKESIARHGVVDPLIINTAPGRGLELKYPLQVRASFEIERFWTRMGQK